MEEGGGVGGGGWVGELGPITLQLSIIYIYMKRKYWFK